MRSTFSLELYSLRNKAVPCPGGTAADTSLCFTRRQQGKRAVAIRVISLDLFSLRLDLFSSLTVHVRCAEKSPDSYNALSVLSAIHFAFCFYLTYTTLYDVLPEIGNDMLTLDEEKKSLLFLVMTTNNRSGHN